MNVKALQKAFNRVKDKFRNNEHQKVPFFKVRDNIDRVVQSCADNVKVKINCDLLDDPIIIYAGKAENVLQISILREDEKPRFSWTEETLAKCASDLVSNIASNIRVMFRWDKVL